ncbi:hypothetical protein [Vibrio sp. SCSIO 43136]|uniref:hypothetical protein n=1 Tax=Vibrio sp. SCSIO 43136 TaxID=2819101 RepID=UPI00207600B5|nr:hypothetical protein [Vibrio sp. SCSIO 43136]USD66063.1 hypothetical protein J4N39_04360 [Vibrio sp. SCSIO 43136]
MMRNYLLVSIAISVLLNGCSSDSNSSPDPIEQPSPSQWELVEESESNGQVIKRYQPSSEREVVEHDFDSIKPLELKSANFLNTLEAQNYYASQMVAGEYDANGNHEVNVEYFPLESKFSFEAEVLDFSIPRTHHLTIQYSSSGVNVDSIQYQLVESGSTANIVNCMPKAGELVCSSSLENIEDFNYDADTMIKMYRNDIQSMMTTDWATTFFNDTAQAITPIDVIIEPIEVIIDPIDGIIIVEPIDVIVEPVPEDECAPTWVAEPKSRMIVNPCEWDESNNRNTILAWDNLALTGPTEFGITATHMYYIRKSVAYDVNEHKVTTIAYGNHNQYKQPLATTWLDSSITPKIDYFSNADVVEFESNKSYHDVHPRNVQPEAAYPQRVKININVLQYKKESSNYDPETDKDQLEIRFIASNEKGNQYANCVYRYIDGSHLEPNGECNGTPIQQVLDFSGIKFSQYYDYTAEVEDVFLTYLGLR